MLATGALLVIGLSWIAQKGAKYYAYKIAKQIQGMKFSHLGFYDEQQQKLNDQINQNCLFHKTLSYMTLTKFYLIQQSLQTSVMIAKKLESQNNQLQNLILEGSQAIQSKLNSIQTFVLNRENRFCSGAVDNSIEGVQLNYVDFKHEQLQKILGDSIEVADKINAKILQSNVLEFLFLIKSEVFEAQPNDEKVTGGVQYMIDYIEKMQKLFGHKINQDQKVWKEYLDNFCSFPHLDHLKRKKTKSWFQLNAQKQLEKFTFVQTIKDEKVRDKITSLFHAIAVLTGIYMTVKSYLEKKEFFSKFIKEQFEKLMELIPEYIDEYQKLQNDCQKYIDDGLIDDCKDIGKYLLYEKAKAYLEKEFEVEQIKQQIINKLYGILGLIVGEMTVQAFFTATKKVFYRFVGAAIGFAQAVREFKRLTEVKVRKEVIESIIKFEQNFAIVQEKIFENTIRYHQCCSTAFVIQSFQEMDTNSVEYLYEKFQFKTLKEQGEKQSPEIAEAIKDYEQLQKEQLLEFCEKFSYLCAQKIHQTNFYEQLSISEHQKKELENQFQNYYDEGYLSDIHILKSNKLRDINTLQDIGYKKLFTLGAELEKTEFQSQYNIYGCRMCSGKQLINIKIYQHGQDDQIGSPRDAILAFIKENNLQAEKEKDEMLFNVFSFAGKLINDKFKKKFYLVTQSKNIQIEQLERSNKQPEKNQIDIAIYGLKFTLVSGVPHIQPLKLPWNQKTNSFSKTNKINGYKYDKQEFEKYCPSSKDEHDDDLYNKLQINESVKKNNDQIVLQLQQLTCENAEFSNQRCSFDGELIRDSFKFKFLNQNTFNQNLYIQDPLMAYKDIFLCKKEDFFFKNYRFLLKSKLQNEQSYHSSFAEIWKEKILPQIENWTNGSPKKLKTCSSYIKLNIHENKCESLRFIYDKFDGLDMKVYQPICNKKIEELKKMNSYFSMEVEHEFFLRILFSQKNSKSQSIDPIFYNFNYKTLHSNSRKASWIYKYYFKFQKSFPGFFLLPNSQPIYQLKDFPGYSISLGFLVRPKIQSGFVPIYPFPFLDLLTKAQEFFWNSIFLKPERNYIFEHYHMRNKKFYEMNGPLYKSSNLFQKMSITETLPTIEDFRKQFDDGFGSTYATEKLTETQSLAKDFFEKFYENAKEEMNTQNPLHFFFPVQLKTGYNQIQCEQIRIQHEDLLLIIEKQIDGLNSIPNNKVYYLELIMPLDNEKIYPNKLSVIPENINESQFNYFNNHSPDLDQNLNEWTLMSYGFLPNICKINNDSPQKDFYLNDFILRRRIQLQQGQDVITYGVRMWARYDYRIPFLRKDICKNYHKTFTY